MDRYSGVSCQLFDQFELFSMRATPVMLELKDKSSLRGTITDVFSRENAEWLKIVNHEGEKIIRLDQIETVSAEGE